MQDVGQQKFLMLRFMVAAEFDQIARGIGEHREQRRIDMGTISADIVERGPRQHPPLRAGMAIPLAVIIAVEQIMISRVENLIPRHMVAQDEGFEKPCGMRQMPFGGRRIGHRLDRGVGIRQRRGKRQHPRPRDRILLRKHIGRESLRCHDCLYHVADGGTGQRGRRFP